MMDGKQHNFLSLTRQKYSYRRLLALGEDGEQYVDSFRWSFKSNLKLETSPTKVIEP